MTEKGQAYGRHIKYAQGRRRTSSGRWMTGIWALHATKGWRKVG